MPGEPRGLARRDRPAPNSLEVVMQPFVWIAVGTLAGAFLSAVLGRFGSLKSTRPVGADARTAAQEVEATLKKIGKWERAAIDRLIQRGAPRNPAAAFEEQMTFG